MYSKTPSIFLSHGSPMLALEDAPTTHFLRGLAADLPRPKAIVIVSAHFETDIVTVTGGQKLETIYDFGGFPAELYQLKYPASGDIEISQHVVSILADAGINANIDNSRGLDHGAWNPLLLMYPDADIPVIAVSIQPHKDAAWHYKVGQALSSLTDENILVIGTGNLTHNLREAFRGKNYEQTPEWVSAFAQWVEDRLKANDIESLLKWETLAPYAHQNHPTADHFLPFFVALGAGGKKLHAEKLHDDVALNVLAMDAYAFL